MHPRTILLPFVLLVTASIAAPTPEPAPGREHHQRLRPMLPDNLDRPLRYQPDAGDFVKINGAECFNRPLYGCSSPFRVDAGDRAEFSFYLPGRGGNLRLGILSGKTAKWLDEAAFTEARYHAGMMVYQLRDPAWGGKSIQLTALSTRSAEGFLLEITTPDDLPKAELLVACGGNDGAPGGRNGDIGCEAVPVREFFAFDVARCKNNSVDAAPGSWILSGKAGSIAAILPPDAKTGTANAAAWNDPAQLAASADQAGAPVAFARLPLAPGAKLHLGFKKTAPKESPESFRKTLVAGEWSHARLQQTFKQESQAQREIANRVAIETPDPFLNAAMPALNVAADAVWDSKNGGFLHGAVAWRVLLLGWRCGYAGDALGWHDRTRSHFDRFAKKQNTQPVPEIQPGPDQDTNLARSGKALKSNGNLSHSAYDMNSIAVDTILRHLMWTGDLDYARKIWPVLESHMAWQKRLFRREFGPEKLPIYEAYCCIWASDNLAYSGGGATHESAYVLYHNRQMARLACILGTDPAPYEREAELLEKGMRQHLWLPDRGWFAEWKDWLGEQAVHPEAAAWTFYHTVDSEAASPLDAWQMGRAVETRLAHFPVRGPGVPQGGQTIATTKWMPYSWSLNNVVMAETLHTALSLWQAGRDEHALSLLRGSILDSMFLGICPGNVGMCTWYDVNRRESQRDFADACGVMSRTMLEGLFGVVPDLLDGKVTLRPGFPADWNHASIRHPDFQFAFRRDGMKDRYTFTPGFAKPVATEFVLPARRDQLASVTVNGRKAEWKFLPDSVGKPRVLIPVPVAAETVLEIVWAGETPAAPPSEIAATQGQSITLPAGANVLALQDPQMVLDKTKSSSAKVSGVVRGTAGHRTLFARVRQGQMEWWQPLAINVAPSAPEPRRVFVTDWSRPAAGKLEPIPMDGLFNEDLTRIFLREYLSPRSPFCSLAMAKQGLGTWCHPHDTFTIDDSGLRKSAAANGGHLRLPNGVPIATPSAKDARNIAIVSQWDNHPRQVDLPLTGRATKAYLLMAGTTDAMRSRCDNGELIVHYQDGSNTLVPLDNPNTWWPLETDYFIDEFAFSRPGPLPLRVDLKSGRVRVLEEKSFIGKGGSVPGGAATVLDLQLDPTKELKSLTVRAVANEVLVGLMGVTLERE